MKACLVWRKIASNTAISAKTLIGGGDNDGRCARSHPWTVFPGSAYGGSSHVQDTWRNYGRVHAGDDGCSRYGSGTAAGVRHSKASRGRGIQRTTTPRLAPSFGTQVCVALLIQLRRHP